MVNKAPYLVILILLIGCTEVREEPTKDPVSLDGGYTCEGKVINNLCYMGSEFIPIDTYEDDQIKIWAEFEQDNTANTAFTLYIQNKLNQELSLKYQYYVRNDVYEKMSSDFLTNDNAPKRGLEIAVGPGETKELEAVFKRKDTDKLSPFLSIIFWFEDGFDTGFLTYSDIHCIGNKMTWSPSPDSTDTATCCNDVVYPSAECCVKSDCKAGVCIDSQCMTEERKYPMYNNEVHESALAIGTKNILYLSVSDSYETGCHIENNPQKSIFSIVERFYDNQAGLLLGEDDDFLNFNWHYVQVKASDTGVSASESEFDVIDKVVDHCNIDPDDFDLTVVEADPGLTSNWCGGPGCAGIGYIHMTGLDSQLENPTVGNTLLHEINHFFGALDLYEMAGAYHQWNGCLQGPHSQERMEDPNLQIVRAEIGWADLDSNGIIDVVEDYETQNS